MHRAVLTPKRLISNLFAISPYIVKVIPLAGIAAGSLLPVDFGHGQFTRLDRDFILQKTILSRQLWKQTARRQYRPPRRAHPRAPGRAAALGAGIPSPRSPPPSALPSTSHAQGVGRRGAEERGCSPPLGRPSPHGGGPQAFPAGVALGDSACPPLGPHGQCLHRLCSRQDGGTEQWAPLLVILASPSPVPVDSSGKAWCQH